MRSTDFKDAKILIVDDNQSNIDVLSQMLEYEGYKNVVYTTYSTRVESLLESFEPDLLLLDLIMPELSGFDILEMMKKKQMNSIFSDNFIPILVLTADLSKDNKQRVLRGGAKDFIAKPFDILEVSLRIRNLLETKYFYQLLKSRNMFLEQKIVEFLKIKDDWYK
jgi:two-component system, sensor histidine kinase and response regulator